ncbi:MAG: hypothetical protein ACOC3V_00855 [bacterium]
MNKFKELLKDIKNVEDPSIYTIFQILERLTEALSDQFNKKDDPVPSLDLLKEEIYQEFLDETMWQNKHFKKKLDKIFSKYQNGVETNKEQPKKDNHCNLHSEYHVKNGFCCKYQGD